MLERMQITLSSHHLRGSTVVLSSANRIAGEQLCLEGSYIIPWHFKYVYTGADSRLEDRHPPLP